MNMGLMGFIRSGLRGDWHIFGVMRDTSEWAYTPSNFTMTQMVGLSVLTFLVDAYTEEEAPTAMSAAAPPAAAETVPHFKWGQTREKAFHLDLA